MAFFEFLGGAVAQARRDIAIAQQTARDKELDREDKISNALTEAKKDLQEDQLRDDAALAIGKTVLNNNPGAGGSKLLESMSDEQITALGYNHTLQKSKKSDLNDASFVRAVASRAFVRDDKGNFKYRDPFELPKKTDVSATTSLEETQKSFGAKFGEAIGVTPRSMQELIREETQDPKSQQAVSRVLAGKSAVDRKPTPVLEAEVVDDLGRSEEKALYNTLYKRAFEGKFDAVSDSMGNFVGGERARQAASRLESEKPGLSARVKIIEKLQSLKAFDQKTVNISGDVVDALVKKYPEGEIPSEVATRIQNREIASIYEELKQDDPEPATSSKPAETPKPRVADESTRITPEEYRKLSPRQKKQYTSTDGMKSYIKKAKD